MRTNDPLREALAKPRTSQPLPLWADLQRRIDIDGEDVKNWTALERFIWRIDRCDIDEDFRTMLAEVLKEAGNNE